MGPVYTLQALYFNAIGGKQDRGQNAALLRLVGYQLHEKGRSQEALAAIIESVALEKDDATMRFAMILGAIPGSPLPKRFSIFTLATAFPSFAIVGLLLLGILWGINQPSGYAARYTGKTGEIPVETASPSQKGSSRTKINDLVEELASEVHANATPTGTRQEGTTTIRDYQLDRAKYQPAAFYKISSQIEPFLDDQGANSDGFASSAYYNAQMMGLSIAILNGFGQGMDVSHDVERVRALDQDVRIHNWLYANGGSTSFESLVSNLKKIELLPPDGTSHAQRKAALKALDSPIQQSESLITQARTERDAEAEHTWVESHNQWVVKFNSTLKTDKRRQVLYEKVDVGFNKCLDARILLSRFQEVNITSGASEIESQPDDQGSIETTMHSP